MFTTLVIATAALGGPEATLPISVLARHDGIAPYVEVWTGRDGVYDRGDRVRVFFETDIDAYVTIFRVDTDGRVRVLFPIDPWDDNYARGGVEYQLESRQGAYAFRVDDYPGQGYLFAVASADPYGYAGYARGNHWDYRAIAEGGRVTGDPYVALGGLIEGIVPPGYLAYSYDVVPYHVERQYDYPRFLCYDCHAYAAWPYWDPYHNPCFRFRIVIYDDPYYYPARAVPGTRVIYRTRTQVVPRYVFKDRDPDRGYVVHVRERPVDDRGRRTIESGATRRVLTGGDRVPAPVIRDRARPAPTVRPRPAPAPRVVPRPRLERRDPNRRVGPARPPGRRGNEAAPRTPERRDPPARPATPRRNTPEQAPTRRAGPTRPQPERQPARRTPPRRRRN